MKNKVWLLAGLFSIMSFSTLIFSTESQKRINLFTLLNIEQIAHAEDLPELEIICGAVDGPCWDGGCDDVTHTPFGSYRSWSCDTATGNPNNVCYDGVPC